MSLSISQCLVVCLDAQLKPTSFHLGIDLKSLIPGVDGPVSVVHLTQQQRRVRGAVFLIFMIAQRDVVKMSVLENKRVECPVCWHFEQR